VGGKVYGVSGESGTGAAAETYIGFAFYFLRGLLSGVSGAREVGKKA